MGVASGCGEQEVGVASGSGWNIWVWLLGVAVRRSSYYLPLFLLYPFFFKQHPCFLFIKNKKVFALVPELFCNYILCIK